MESCEWKVVQKASSAPNVDLEDWLVVDFPDLKENPENQAAVSWIVVSGSEAIECNPPNAFCLIDSELIIQRQDWESESVDHGLKEGFNSV